MIIEAEEFMKISRELEKHHSVFYALWETGKPVFTNMVETAAISFNDEGESVEFLFNQDFWNNLNDYERKFVICHECLHVVLNHGIRTRDSQTKFASNIAVDLIVNHTLVNKFGFEREKISGDLCWVDVVFDKEDEVPDDKYFEYYYNLLGDTKTIEVQFIDDHTALGQSEWEQPVRDLNDRLDDSEKESLKQSVEKHFQDTGNNQAGSSPGGWWTFVDTSEVRKKRKWETVIQEWAKHHIKKDFSDQEQWARLNRRFAFLNPHLMLPSEMETEHETKKEKKITVFFFQDTSYSCRHFATRFFKAAKSLPEDRFDVRLFCFDTQVYETSLESGKLYGFGGTMFDIIEERLQIEKEKDGEYCKAAFIVTDGYSSTLVSPEFPKRWHVFLMTSCRAAFDPSCNFYNLNDFE